jgi:GNAT superfamily N-acetyltransferase
MWILQHLESKDASTFADFTFASMRTALRSVSADGPHIAIGAKVEDKPIGLVYGEIDESQTGHVRSLFVTAAFRNQGIGASLLNVIEQEFRRRGCAGIHVSYVSGRPSTEALERLLRSQGWTDPEPETLFCRVDERMLNWWVYQKQGWLAGDFSLFDWTELTAQDREYIVRTQAETPWIPEDLVPFQYEKNFEPLNSFGIRHKGRPVGWMITHRLTPDTIRYTCSYIDTRLQKLFKIIPIYQEAYRRQSAAGIPYALFMVPYRHTAMVNFTKKHWVNKFAIGWDSRSCSKALAARSMEAHAR